MNWSSFGLRLDPPENVITATEHFSYYYNNFGQHFKTEYLEILLICREKT